MDAARGPQMAGKQAAREKEGEYIDDHLGHTLVDLMQPARSKADQAKEVAAARDTAMHDERDRAHRRDRKSHAQENTRRAAAAEEEDHEETALHSGTTSILMDAQDQLERFAAADRTYGVVFEGSEEALSAEEALKAEVYARVERIAAGGNPGLEDSPQSLSSKLAALTMTHVRGMVTPPGSRSPSPAAGVR